MIPLTKSKARITPANLSRAINADAGIGNKVKMISYASPKITLWFEEDLPNSTEEALIDGHIAAASDLDELKDRKNLQIDRKTDVDIENGFTYDSKQFSLSPIAQINWNNYKNNQSEYSWPLLISTISNEPYSLTSTNVAAFWEAQRKAIDDNRRAGLAFKKNVFNAADHDALDLVVDTR